MTSAPPTVRLLEADVDLAERLSAEARAEATPLVRALVLGLRRGELPRRAVAGAHASLRGLLVLDGLLARVVRLNETTSLQLLGAGDLVEVAGDPLSGQLLPLEMRWVVLEPARVAAIDDALLQQTLAWPELAAALFERATVQSAHLATRCAISQLPRVEERIEALLWFLAERFGRITANGILLSLRLTHDAIGQMIGAKRPTVSLALRELEQARTVQRGDDGAWLLRAPERHGPQLIERPGGGVRRMTREQSAAERSPAARIAAAAESDWRAEWTRQVARDRELAAASEMAVRLERMRRVHDSTRLRVTATLRNAATTRADSVELRTRLRSDDR